MSSEEGNCRHELYSHMLFALDLDYKTVSKHVWVLAVRRSRGILSLSWHLRHPSILAMKIHYDPWILPLILVVFICFHVLSMLLAQAILVASCVAWLAKAQTPEHPGVLRRVPQARPSKVRKLGHTWNLWGSDIGQNFWVVMTCTCTLSHAIIVTIDVP